MLRTVTIEHYLSSFDLTAKIKYLIGGLKGL